MTRQLGPDLLFVPGHDEGKLAKAETLGADAVILDLEDSVSLERKPAARKVVQAFLGQTPRRTGTWLVRVNSLGSGQLLDDLSAINGLPMDGVVIPKVEDPDVIRVVDKLLRGGDLGLYALIETARGVMNISAVASTGAGLRGLMFGHADLANDIGATIQRPFDRLLGHARASVVVAAAACGLVAYDTPYENFRDSDGLRDEATTAKELGYIGKLAIHPTQLPVIREVWTPTAAEVTRARAVIEAFDRAQRTGSAVAVLEGALIERQMAATAQRILDRAARAAPA
jgi:citrate lyase beta subunit